MIVFLDMDGVLVDFRKGALLAHGREDDEATRSVDYNFWREWGISDEEFWRPLSSVEAWAEMPELPWAGKLYSLCARKTERVFFCTCPCMAENSATGKLLWLSRFLGRTIRPDEYFLGMSKSFLSKPGSLLIDDKEDYCRQWDKEGGGYYLWPAPWNISTRTPDEAMEILERKVLA